MTTDVFNGDTPPAGGTGNPPPSSGSDPFADLVGEGKKFKTAQDLAKAKLESDAFIERLKNENAGMRTDIEKAADAQAMLEELRTEIIKLKGSSAPAPTGGNPALSVDDVRALVNESLTNAERNRTAQQNITAANDAMVRQFGSLAKGAEAVQTKSAELGISVEDLKAIAAKSPSAFEKIILEGKQVSGEAGPLNPKSETPMAPNGGGQLQPNTKEWFDDMRVKNPKQYWQPATQMQLHKAVQEGTYKL